MTISAHWQTQIEKWEKSGLTLVIFCQQNNLKYSTFCARLTEYRVIHRALPTQTEVKLIPIEVKHLMVDDYGGYKSLFFSEGEKPACIELACLAHARRKFFDLHQVSQSPLALEAPRSFVVFVGFANTHCGFLAIHPNGIAIFSKR